MSVDTAKAITSLNALTGRFDVGALQVNPFYPRICTVAPSNHASEDYAFLGAFPKVREWIGERAWNQLRAGRFQIVNKEWEDSLLIQRTDIEDDRLGFYGGLMEGMGKRAAQHPDNLVFALIAAAESALCFDGQYFYDTDHSWGDSGTQSNALTYNATDHTAVTAAEWQSSFEAALIAMMGFKDDRGELFHQPVIGQPSDLIAVVPLALWKVASQALKAQVIEATSNVNIGIPELVVAPGLASTKWQLHHVGNPLRPFVFQPRRPMQRQMKGMDDREFKDVKFMTDARYNAGYGVWWESVLTTFN